MEILGRNVTEETIASKMEEDERDASQISFGDFRWLLAECENDFDAADEAEAAHLRALAGALSVRAREDAAVPATFAAGTSPIAGAAVSYSPAAGVGAAL